MVVTVVISERPETELGAVEAIPQGHIRTDEPDGVDRRAVGRPSASECDCHLACITIKRDKTITVLGDGVESHPFLLK